MGYLIIRTFCKCILKKNSKTKNSLKFIDKVLKTSFIYIKQYKFKVNTYKIDSAYLFQVDNITGISDQF